MATRPLRELTARLTEAVNGLDRPEPGQAVSVGEAALWDRLDAAIRTVGATLRALSGVKSGLDPDEFPRDFLHGAGVAEGALPDESFVEGIRGHTRAFTVPELLGFVSSSYKSGLLRVRTKSEDFLVQFDGGAVVYAKSDHPPSGQHLTEILVAQGSLRPQDLAEVRSKETKKENALVEELVGHGRLSKEDVERAAALQVQALFRRLCSASDAYFCFYDGGSAVSQPGIRMNVTQLLLESARVMDEEAHREQLLAAERAAELPQEPPVVDVEHSGTQEEAPSARARAALEHAIATEAIELPVVRGTASELLAICWDEDSDAESLRERISGDQGLCAHLLRVANSSYYAPAVPIISVQLAIARLGMVAIREIALALTVKQEAFDAPGWERLVLDMWRRAGITGGFAKEICKTVGQGQLHGGLIGLLQDIGKPVVLNALSTIQREEGIELEQRDALELVEEFHAEVGASLAHKWSMPEWLQAVLRHHHDCGQAQEHEWDVLVAHLSDRLATWALRRDEDEVEELVALPVCAQLGLSEEQLRDLLDETDRILEAAESFA